MIGNRWLDGEKPRMDWEDDDVAFGWREKQQKWGCLIRLEDGR